MVVPDIGPDQWYFLYVNEDKSLSLLSLQPRRHRWRCILQSTNHTCLRSTLAALSDQQHNIRSGHARRRCIRIPVFPTRRREWYHQPTNAARRCSRLISAVAIWSLERQDMIPLERNQWDKVPSREKQHSGGKRDLYEQQHRCAAESAEVDVR
jgi:hypothetical protein